MPGVIALLPEPFAARVEGLWDTMERQFGIPRGYPGAVPHLSFHIGEHRRNAGSEPIVQQIARSTAPFLVSTAGMGVFGGTPPVVHLAVARSPRVASLAERLTEELDAAGFPPTDPYFSAEKWIPHITIAHQNLESFELGPMLEWLAKQDLAWNIPLTSISVARETSKSAVITATFPLGGQ